MAELHYNIPVVNPNHVVWATPLGTTFIEALFEEQLLYYCPEMAVKSPDIHNSPRVPSVIVHWRVMWLSWRGNAYSELIIE